MTDIHRQHDIAVFGNLIGHDNGIQDLLVVFAEHLNPSHFTYGHGILLPAPHALGRNPVTRNN